MLPPHYFELICCPRCRGGLAQTGDGPLRCVGCAAEYPVVEGIPVLLPGSKDAVSDAVSSFYSGAWGQVDREQPLARVVHDDVSRCGERYVLETEARFRAELAGRGGSKRFFLDAACGAFPRRNFGEDYTYHVCLDFTLEALLKARRLLGERAVCVCGSLLQAPLRDGVCDGILASHCIYHIDKDLQGTAVHELLRMLAPGGKLVIFYGNPDNVNSRLLRQWRYWPLKKLLGLARRYAPPPPALVSDEVPVYCYLHPIETMMRELTSVHPDARVSVRPLCLFQFGERAPLFQAPGRLPELAYWLYMGLEKLYERRPDMSYYLTYIAERAEAPARS